MLSDIIERQGHIIKNFNTIVEQLRVYVTNKNRRVRFVQAASTPALSDRIEIESYSVIESNVLAQLESNRMQIESNVFFFHFRFSIRFDLEKIMKQKIQNNDSKK